MSAGASTSRVAIRIAEEVVPGQIPPIAMQQLSNTGDSLVYSKASTQSETIRPDENIEGYVLTNLSNVGGINFEFKYAAYDALLRGAMRSDWSSPKEVTNTDISFDNGDNSINSLGGEFTFVADDWVRVEGSASNDGYWRVASSPAPDANKIVVAGDTTITTEGAGATITVGYNGKMVNGTTERSFFVEKEWTDVAGDNIQQYLGMQVNTLSLDLTSESIVTGTAEFIGLTGDYVNTSGGTGGPDPEPTGERFNAVTSVGSVFENNAVLSGVFLQNLAWNCNRNLRGQPAIANLGFVGIASGQAVFTGSLNSYLSNTNLLKKLLTDEVSAVSFRLSDPLGQGYVFDITQIKYTEGPTPTPGANQDVFAELSYGGFFDANSGGTCTMFRFDAL